MNHYRATLMPLARLAGKRGLFCLDEGLASIKPRRPVDLDAAITTCYFPGFLPGPLSCCLW